MKKLDDSVSQLNDDFLFDGGDDEYDSLEDSGTQLIRKQTQNNKKKLKK